LAVTTKKTVELIFGGPVIAVVTMGKTIENKLIFCGLVIAAENFPIFTGQN
jgi:hypothetical protein